jgi:hypothetical protein
MKVLIHQDNSKYSPPLSWVRKVGVFALWNLLCWSQNVHVMYKMHVISQNSRRKASAEDEGSNVLYRMHSTLQSGQVAKEKDAPCSKAKKSPSHVLYFALVRSLKKKCIVSWTKIYLRATVQDDVLRIHPQLLFLLQRYRSARQTPIKNSVLGLEKQLQLFFCFFLCTKMAAPFYTHTEVCYAGHKMTF